ncbi:molecular chaperone [Ferrimonas balearica]|uniref:molecular chaperone n=1 Tax=Ferrimonas balearica TaxID=44012 RepID=UPI001C9978C7|nr:molecular chaperone [Ferrimonas balearica]MBY5920487.1 molecular chaperone [Ferrimonas balearica]MBY5996828.1 molecular chaperone [Ferrimonas balearica]
MKAIAGIDFGTSNCGVGVVRDGKPQLLNLPQHGRFMPSTLYAARSEVIAGWLYRQLKEQGREHAFQQARQHSLSASLHALTEAKLDGYEDQLHFGDDALSRYLEDPSDCYYIRSHKSFLGGSGLSPRQQEVLEDITASMLFHLLNQIDDAGQGAIRKLVVGRPINFQGFNSERSNEQATAIIRRAARHVGIEQLEFMYEPMAAGLTFQQTLSKEQRVLVVDIGGGTTDISMVLMGPGDMSANSPESQVLGHCGKRIGGNDFDVALNYKALMPALGLGLTDQKGRMLPTQPFHDAAAVNNLSAQTRFYSTSNRHELDALRRQPGLGSLSRLMTLQRNQMTFQQSAVAERAKISLSEYESTQADLSYIEHELAASVNRTQFGEAAQGLMKQIFGLIDDTLAQAGCQPDLVFLTGGSANSPYFRNALSDRFDTRLVQGDNFGSVTTGLALWADRIFD